LGVREREERRELFLFRVLARMGNGWRKKKGRGRPSLIPSSASLPTVACKSPSPDLEIPGDGLEILGWTLLSTVGAEDSRTGNSNRRGLEIPGRTLFPTVGLPH